MVDISIMVVFSILNMVGIFYWFKVMLASMDIVFCKEVKINFRVILSKQFCVRWRRLKRRLNLSDRYSGAMLLFAGSIVAILLKMSELREVGDYSSLKVCGRVITSLLLPSGVMHLYRVVGYNRNLIK